MQRWSKFKKTAIISAVVLLGLGGVGTLTNSNSTHTNVNLVTPASFSTPKVQGQNTQNQNTIQTTPPQTSTPAPTPEPTSPPPVAQSANSNCDPNYSGACVPNVYPSDVDCAGGSGNGPYYVQGPVHVIGIDRYGLDRDGDGLACE